MDSKQKERVYEEFDPTIEWERDSAADTLKVYLPGFRKEQLKVQVTTTRVLRISGERESGENKVIKFRKEIPISSNYDTNQISAKFEKGTLFIKHPKIIIPDRQPQQILAEPPKSPAQPPKPPAQPPKVVPRPPKPPAQPPKDAPKPPKPPAQPFKDAPKPPKPQPPPKIDQSPKPPQPKVQPPPQQEKLKQSPPPLAEIESPKPELPSIESDAEKTGKNEIPEKVEETKSDSDEINAAGITNVAGADMKQEIVTGDSDDVGHGDKVAAGIGRLNYRQVLSEAVKELKNPKKLMECVVTAFVVMILWLRSMIMKPIKYFTKSEIN